MFLKNTVEDILKNKRGDTEIIVGLDGEWSEPPLEQHPDLNVMYYSASIGQRSIANQCVKLSRAKYIMKVDAHCAFDEGFDVKMMDLMEDDITSVPVMRNLHAFNWVCPDGHSRYQGPSGPCQTEVGKDKNDNPILCGKPTIMDMKWIAKTNPQSTAYRFDKTMHFQYWTPYGKKQTGNMTPTLSLQGSCFMCTRDKYIELDLCSETFNSWGQQGVEVACKTWLSGGRVLVNRTTWYAHMFRTQGGDFSFPYPQSGRQLDENRRLSREMFMGDKWPKAIHKFEWLLEKFKPIPDWHIPS